MYPLRSSGGDDDIGAMGLRVQRAVGHNLHGDPSVRESGRDLFSPFQGTVGDEKAGRTLLDEVADGELGHLSRAHEQDVFVGERAEDLSRKVDGDGRDRDGSWSRSGSRCEPSLRP